MMPIKFLSKCKNNYSDIPASCERDSGELKTHFKPRASEQTEKARK